MSPAYNLGAGPLARAPRLVSGEGMDAGDCRDEVLAFARAEGFELIRFAAATPIPESRDAARAALAAGRLEGMEWITAAWLERATAPESFVAGARTVMLVALPCHPPAPSDESVAPCDDASSAGATRGRVARYAWGRDYHRVFEKKLRRIARRIRDELGAGKRANTDSHPPPPQPPATAEGTSRQR
ncbi:MAG: QueG-associated DUF1730 domain-containing protein, partial [Tepidiformaceae bacterium]